MKKVAILLNGQINNSEKFAKEIRQFNHIVAADGGCNYILSFGLQKKLLFAAGDFDSFLEPELFFPKEKIIRFPPEKDYTDAFGCFTILTENHDFDEYHFFGVSGEREDHFLSLVFSFAHTRNKVFFHNDHEFFLFLHPGSHIFREKGKTFSIFPLTPVKNLVLSGTYYEFSSKEISLTGQGVSNIFSQETAHISFSNGVLFMSILEKTQKTYCINK